MYEGDCNQAVVFLFTLNYLNVRNNEYGLEFFRQIFKLEGLRGQKAAIVIRLYYEEERQKAKERMSLGGKGGLKEGLPDLADLPVSRDVSEELAKKAGIGRSSMTYLIAVYRNRPDLFPNGKKLNISKMPMCQLWDIGGRT